MIKNKKITKESVTLKEDSEPNIMVQTTSRRHTWVQATKQYDIGGDGVEPVRMGSERSAKSKERSFEKQFKDFLDKSTTKKAKNDKAKKNPDTPEA